MRGKEGKKGSRIHPRLEILGALRENAIKKKKKKGGGSVARCCRDEDVLDALLESLNRIQKVRGGKEGKSESNSQIGLRGGGSLGKRGGGKKRRKRVSSSLS